MPETSVPRISIVTPSYNHARFLRQCIDSVLTQDDPNVELIVVDGASTDESVEILRSYGERIRWVSEKDKGQSHAINRGIAMCTGQIFSWLNSDDYLLPGALAKVRACLAAHPEAAFMYGKAWRVDEHGERLSEYRTKPPTRKQLASTCLICQPTVFMPMSTITRFGTLNENLHICLDYEWWLRITREAPFAFCDAFLAAQREYSATKTKARRLRSLIESGYLMQHHFGSANLRWCAKWAAHRAALNPCNWVTAIPSALRYRRRFAGGRSPSRYGARLLRSLR